MRDGHDYEGGIYSNGARFCMRWIDSDDTPFFFLILLPENMNRVIDIVVLPYERLAHGVVIHHDSISIDIFNFSVPNPLTLNLSQIAPVRQFGPLVLC